LTTILTTSNVTCRHQGPKWKLQASYSASSLQCTSYLCVVLSCRECSIFHRSVWYCMLSLRYACIRHSGIIVPNFVSVMPSIAELACGEKSHTEW